MTEELKPCPLTWAIQRLNSTPYSLTKDECVDVLRGLRDELRALTAAQPAQATRTTADTLREIKAASCKDCAATGYTDPGEADSPDGPGRPAVVCGACMGTGWRDGVHISDQQATPEPVPSYAVKAHAQIEHLLNDLTVEEVHDGLTFYIVKRDLRTSNLIGALRRLHAEHPTATPEPVGEPFVATYSSESIGGKQHDTGRVNKGPRGGFFASTGSPEDARLIADALNAYNRPAPGVPDGWKPIQTAPTDGTKFLGWRRGRVATAYRVQRDDCEMWSFGGESGAFEHWPETRPEFWMPHPPEPALAAAQANGVDPEDLAAAGVMLTGRRSDHA